MWLQLCYLFLAWDLWKLTTRIALRSQVEERNENLSENDHVEEQEVRKSNNGTENNASIKKVRCKGILFEMEHLREQLPNDVNELEQITI